MDNDNKNTQVSREEEERRLLENIKKRQKGKPARRVRHGAVSWRTWIEDDGEDDS
jgi:hypothetical protein